MFALGFRDFLHSTVPPPNAYRVDVLGRMWNWQFTYPNGRSSNDLHIPKDTPVQFFLTSQDVIHSLYIPAFRMKKDVVPGRFNNLWVEATEEGIFDIFCTEYCGTDHSRMLAKCFVYSEDNYPAALDRITNIYEDFVTGEPLPPEQVGAALWTAKGCIGCHSTDGSILQAPTWKDLFGSTRIFTDGSSVVADENYIRQSILEPHVRIVQGYGATMPTFAGQLDDRDLSSIIAYIQSLSGEFKRTQGGQILGPGQSQSIGADEQHNK
jgi:cytochrome c oxidase subunit 2